MMPPIKSIKSLKRGDVVLVLFPYANDLTKLKKRPALVVQADGLGTDFPQLILALITSEMKRAGKPYRVKIDMTDPKYSSTGLLLDSVILTDYLMTLNQKYIYNKIGKMPDMVLVEPALRKALAL